MGGRLGGWKSCPMSLGCLCRAEEEDPSPPTPKPKNLKNIRRQMIFVTLSGFSKSLSPHHSSTFSG